MTLALLCSGQGRVEPTMLDLFAGRPEVEAILATSTELLGKDPRQLLQEGDEARITENRTGQILCAVRSLAAAACLGIDTRILVAGYSVGEMAAWSIAGFWSASDALRLTARRAELMNDADGDTGGLGFIRGLSAVAAERLLRDHDCAIAISNPGNLLIIGGARDAVAACCRDALASGATSARPIAVRVASHTPRLAAAVDPFLEALRSCPLSRPNRQIMLLGAANANVVQSVTPDLQGLARQVATRVDWSKVIEALIERGARRMLELGPGRAIADMVRGNWPDLPVRALDEFRTIEGAKRWLAAEAQP